MAVAGAVVGGTLSLTELQKVIPKKAKPNLDWVTKALDHALNDPNSTISADTRCLIPQMIEKGMPTPDEFTATGLQAKALVDLMLEKQTDFEMRQDNNTGPFRQIVTPLLEHLLADQEFVKTLAPQIWATALDDLKHIRETTDILAKQFANIAIELGATKDRFMTLARRVATDVPDIDAAHRELESHIQRLSERKERLSHSSNVDAWVDQLLHEMDELAQANNIEMAVQRGREAKSAMHDEIERQKAGYLRIIDETLGYEIESRDVKATINSLFERIQVETPDSSQHYDALRMVQDQWYEKGRDRGLALEVAIGLAQRSCDLAADANQRGAALNDLGIALQTLGQREASTKRLDQAMQAFENALQEWTQARVPLD